MVFSSFLSLSFFDIYIIFISLSLAVLIYLLLLPLQYMNVNYS